MSGSYWERANRRLSRRRLVQGGAAAGVGVAALAAVGCGDDDDDGGSTPAATSAGGSPAATSAGGSPAAAQPKKGGNYNYPQVGSYKDVFDPHTSLFQAAFFFSTIANLSMRPSVDATKIEPELVEKWEVPGDGTEITLTLRQGVTWHNKPPTAGRAFVADDLAFNLTRITGKLNPDKLASFQRASTLPNFESATVVDEKTVKVKLTAPHSGFLWGMSDWRNSIIPRDYVEKGINFADASTLIGTGPFVIESFQDGAKATFKANPNYWEKGKPYLDTVTWVFYGDALASQTGFAKGDVEHITGGSKATNDSILKLNSKAREENWIFGNWNHIRFNTAKKPFDDPRVRLALFKLMNYTVWNDEYYGAGKWDYTGPLAAAFTNDALSSDDIKKAPGYNPATREADIKAGKDALAAAGFTNGKGIDFKIMPFQPTGLQYEMAVRAQDDLKKSLPDAKIDIDIPADTTIFSRRQIAGDFDVISYTLFPAPDAVIEMTNNYQSKGARNYGKYNSPQVDALIQKASTQLDAKERADTLKQAQKILLDTDMPTILYGMPRSITYFQPKVKGMEKYASRIGGGGYDTYANLKNTWLDG